MADTGELRAKLDDCQRLYKRLTKREHGLVYGLVMRRQHGMDVTEQELAALERTWQRIGAGDCGRQD
jgi:hypothetical protein